ncbi:putative transcriptional regulator, ModE family [Methylocella silvestris BL2]|uniref:Putative transcriptional regulator, ModE family n=1 Tax=Methylocella silvestris (strain DSM 15510 / CIP 108128 / LMG 27833 / NCIMB 13906 / BL2) TaxID=395965 RepID=B8EJW0_METSB|nr:LysR family transcriptional regulator [Methylocella silvestris]ACK49907.1 putative transcriptional regulator, ModE family [Methylocella silvestris BL2]
MTGRKRAAATVTIELHWPNGGSLGPADVELIDMIRAKRSIIGASRALGLSYRTCWLSVDRLNRCFDRPIVETFPGRRDWGATVTEFGEDLIALYRSIAAEAAASARHSLAPFSAAADLSFDPKPKAARKARS